MRDTEGTATGEYAVPFFACPTCRLTVRLRATDALKGKACPRCGNPLEGSARRLSDSLLPFRLKSSSRAGGPGQRGSGAG